tara:strand:+ start:196 stop:489 length:294 start_codon:yes stop_codon:yes gene_type:complete
MTNFTKANGFFDIEELEFESRSGRPSVIDWDGIIESGKWYFLPNSLRTEKAIMNNGHPSPPPQILCEGYKFSMRKTKNPNTGENGLGIKCILYPDNV